MILKSKSGWIASFSVIYSYIHDWNKQRSLIGREFPCQHSHISGIWGGCEIWSNSPIFFQIFSVLAVAHLGDVWNVLLFLSCWRCAMWASSPATLPSIPTRGSVQATTSTKACRANGLTMSKWSKHLLQDLFLYCFFFFFRGVGGVGYNSKILFG